MKVLYFHQHFATPRGSTGIRSYQMARGLLRRGHQVTMVCGRYAGGNSGLTGSYHHGRREGVVDGIRVVEFDLPYANQDGFGRRSWLFLQFAWRSIRLTLTEPYDLVFATSTPLTAGIPGICARWLRRKPFVFEVRDLWPELPRAMGVITNPVILSSMSALEWVSYRSAQRLIGLSPGIVEGIVRRGVSREGVTMVPNGCDLSLFSGPEQAWTSDQIAPGQFVAVYTGTHGVANGLDAVVDAAAVLQQRGRDDIKLVLIGDGKTKAELVHRAETEALHQVQFLDPLSKQELAGVLASADIGMQILADVPAFYYGTSPNKFFDYIAAGLPVLTNYPGWLADMIHEHDCGYAVPPRDPEAFADALENAAANRDALQTKGERALALARARFDRGELVEQFVDWLEGAVRGKADHAD